MSSLQSRIRRHLEGGCQESILRLLINECSAKSSDAVLLLQEVFAAESPAMAKAVVLQLCAMKLRQRIADVALHSWPPHEFAWNAIAAIQPCDLTATQNAHRVEWARRLLNPECDGLQASNARLICEQIPELKPELIERVTTATLRTICVFATDNDLKPLIAALANNEDEPLPTVLGLTLTAERLANLYSDMPIVADQLAVGHGYISGVSLQDAKPYLEAGISYVNAAIVEKSVEQVQCHVVTLSGLLVHGANGNWKPLTPTSDHEFDFQRSNFDLGVLFAAVRELDQVNLELRRRASVFDFTAHRDIATDAVRFMHVPESLLRRSLLHDAITCGRECRVPDKLMNQFICEWAATQLAPNDESKIEAELFLRCRWTAMAALQIWCVEQFHTERLGQTRRFPAALSIVVPKGRLDLTNNPMRPRLTRTHLPELLSPCATAVAKFAEVFIDGDRLRELHESFEAAESMTSQHLCPVGVEVQIPLVDNNRHIGWKELFRSVGIPSRRRPECGRMLEASLPPAASTLPVEVFLKMLVEFGVVTQPQDIGIHVSLQGNLHQHGRYLAFPQLFLNRPIRKTRRPRESLRLLMSKGFIHLDSEVRQCPWHDGELVRTELRVFIAGVDNNDGILTVDESLLEAIRSTHIIGSAMLAATEPLQAAVAEFTGQLTTCLDGFPEEFSNLLNANFHESTGDYRDAELLHLLPVLDRFKAVQNASTPELLEELRTQLSHIRRAAADRIWKTMAGGLNQTTRH